MTTEATPSRDPFADARCGGDGCESVDSWPLYHVRHRSIFRRLCAACVLRYHRVAFCSSCFDILDSPEPSKDRRPLVRCSGCPAVSHLGCLHDPQATDSSHYLCPICKNPNGFPYLEASANKTIDLPSAKALLAAARIAANSMSRAAAAAMADAERKGKDSALARKRAREMLERARSICKQEREKMRSAATAAVGPLSDSNKKTVKKKKKKKKKKVQSSQTEKLVNLQGPIQMGNHVMKGVAVCSLQNHAIRDRGKDPSLVTIPVKLKERDVEFKGLTPNPGAGIKEDKVLKFEADKGPSVPQSTQGIADDSISRTNPGALFTGSQNAASLHS